MTNFNFTHWASLMDTAYPDNHNGKIAALFSVMACFRDSVIEETGHFTTLFIHGGCGSGKSAMAESMENLFGRKKELNLVYHTDARMQIELSKYPNEIYVVDEYSDRVISTPKFKMLKAAIYPILQTEETGYINTTPVIVGIIPPQLDDDFLARNCILCECVEPEGRKWGFMQKHSHDLLKQIEEDYKDSLRKIHQEIISQENSFKFYYPKIYRNELIDLQSQAAFSEEALSIIKAYAQLLSVAVFLQRETELTLPFSLKEFRTIIYEKIVSQLELIR